MAVTTMHSLSEMAEQDNLLSLLDKGINDMENENELPLDEAFQKIQELRDERRLARL